MLFTEFSFTLVFFPIVLVIFLILLRFQFTRAILPWLSFASLVFYGWADVRLLGVILVSLAVNYLIGWQIARSGSKVALVCGVLFNLVLLSWIKYAGLVGDTLGINNLSLGLPLIGISFYTFQQIAWLVDMRQLRELPKPWNFVVFVTFFPQLIAGPIVHHAEMMPQFSKLIGKGREGYLTSLPTHLSVGLTIFIIGLFKKVVIADQCALVATPVFLAASGGEDIGTITAWTGALAYSMQIYFDFSGYSDMALGIARMFGIRLPQNFHSPYQASNIIEFWRRWHITLSRWLRDYLYVPLGGNRKGSVRRHINLMTTMLLGGLWHGASWSFLVWGGVHGLFLVINHMWNRYCGKSLGIFGWLITFIAVLHAWVLFRAGNHPNDFETAANVFSAMYNWQKEVSEINYLMVFFATFVALFMPNTYQLLRRYKPVLGDGFRTHGRNPLPVLFLLLPWKPEPVWAVTTATLACVFIYLITRSDAYVEFIYFQF